MQQTHRMQILEPLTVRDVCLPARTFFMCCVLTKVAFKAAALPVSDT
jgi:hypothetical protein